MRSGTRWRDMPERFPSGVTCWRRLRDWEEERGVWNSDGHAARECMDLDAFDSSQRSERNSRSLGDVTRDDVRRLKNKSSSWKSHLKKSNETKPPQQALTPLRDAGH